MAAYLRGLKKHAVYIGKYACDLYMGCVARKCTYKLKLQFDAAVVTIDSITVDLRVRVESYVV